MLSNNRPISLLPQLSKFSEKIFSKRLISFLDVPNIISVSQYGFKANSSTSYAFADATNYITWIKILSIYNLDKNHLTMGIFIDLRKAFDTVNHVILLKKFDFYGIRGVTYYLWCTTKISFGANSLQPIHK